MADLMPSDHLPEKAEWFHHAVILDKLTSRIPLTLKNKLLPYEFGVTTASIYLIRVLNGVPNTLKKAVYTR